MRTVMSTALLLLCLLSTVQGIRLERHVSTAPTQQINEDEKSFVEETSQAVGVVVLCKEGHCSSGHARKLVTDTKASKPKINRVMDVKGKESQKSHQKGVEATLSPAKEMKHEIKAERYPDAVDIAGMDYSPARRRSPIHN